MLPDANELRGIPEYKEWSAAAVRLLQGVVYSGDPRIWNLILRSRSQLDSYFARIGLAVVVDEDEGYAFVRQWNEDEVPSGYEGMPRLVRRVQLGYGPTLVAVLLRDELRRHEEEGVTDERCVVEIDTLFEQWRLFFPSNRDDIELRRDLGAALRKLADLGFVLKFADEPEQWEIRRILKARLPAHELEELRARLSEALLASGVSAPTASTHEDKHG